MVAAEPRVLIAAEHASARFGGEAALALHYYRVLRRRGHEVTLVVHERTRDELSALFPGDPCIRYVADTGFQRAMWRIGSRLPGRIDSITTAFLLRLATQSSQRRVISELVRAGGVDVVHQPMPVSPKEPSLLFGLGVPVVIGPMNGGMDFPPAFRHYQSRWTSTALAAGRTLSSAMNRLMPGKLRSEVLLVANPRTRAALPRGVRGEVVDLVENGVDLGLWTAGEPSTPAAGAPLRLLFMGRLVALKAVDLLIQAFVQACSRAPIALAIAGDGPECERLQSLCRQLGVLAEREGEPGRVRFLGWQTQAQCAAHLRESDALVLPSLMECGGAVVLEAMAAGRPVIATAWGGPADYLDANCGILVAPTSSESFREGLTEAMLQLAADPERRGAMGRAARTKVVEQFDWEVKVDRILDIYRRAIETSRRPKR